MHYLKIYFSRIFSICIYGMSVPQTVSTILFLKLFLLVDLNFFHFLILSFFLRIPSNPSVGSVGSKISSTNSIDRPNSARCSPLPPSYHVEILSPGRPFRPGQGSGSDQSHKPYPGEIRAIHIEKSSEQLGIKIEELPCQSSSSASSGRHGTGGVFVSSVSSNSLADQAGLQVGDQLLEVCGINLRMANYEMAAKVLHRVGNSIDIKVQFNPDKYLDKYNHLVERSDSEEESESSEEEEDEEDRQPPPIPIRRSSPQRSGSPTPRNSPKIARGHHMVHEDLQPQQPPPPQRSSHSTLTRQQVQQIAAQLAARSPGQTLPDLARSPGPTIPDLARSPGPPLPDLARSTGPPLPDREPVKPPSYHDNFHEPRLVYPIMKKSTDLGVRLVGGNAVGELHINSKVIISYISLLFRNIHSQR